MSKIIENPIIILNAPAQSGKDTLAYLLKSEMPTVQLTQFKNPLFYLYCHTAGVDYTEFSELYQQQGWKDTHNLALNNHTPRELLIHISENYIKPFFGNNYFGKALCNQIKFKESTAEKEFTWVIPDGGFNTETPDLIESFGDRVVCIQFTRDGKTFEGDSRNWITNIPKTIYLEHPNDPELFKDLVLKTLDENYFKIN